MSCCHGPGAACGPLPALRRPGHEPRDVGPPGHAAQCGPVGGRRRPHLGPDSGAQACGEVGDGRMLEAAALFEAIGAHFQPKVLRGKRVLVTAGPTFPSPSTRCAASPISPAARWALPSPRGGRSGRRGHADCWPVVLPHRPACSASTSETAIQMFEAVLPIAPARRLYRHGRCGGLATRRRACAQKIKRRKTASPRPRSR